MLHYYEITLYNLTFQYIKILKGASAILIICSIKVLRKYSVFKFMCLLEKIFLLNLRKPKILECF